MEEKLEQRQDKNSLNPIVVVIVAVAVLAVALVVIGQKRKFEPVVAGTAAIDFTLPDLKGSEMALSETRGKVVFLNFWATWCKPCEDEMPSMQALYGRLKGQPFEMVAVSVDKPGLFQGLKRAVLSLFGSEASTDDSEVVREFVQRHKLTFTVLHDRSGKVKDVYKSTGVPETFILDQNGVIAEKVWGPRDWTRPDNIKTILELLQNGPKPPASYLKGKTS
jgi:peroxiredoxin